jgi:metal-responsive CopG/Arc/MetJ family transcriptional regulator
MEQLKKAAYARNTPIIVSIKAVDLKHEHEMVVGWEFNHTFLQDKCVGNIVIDGKG